jgi:hypothetical protein
MILIIWLLVWLIQGTPPVTFNPFNIWAVTLIVSIVLSLK